MKTLIGLSLWLILFILCWPLAIIAILAWPLVWVLSLPFKILGILFTGVFTLLTAMVTLPARLLGWRPASAA